MLFSLRMRIALRKPKINHIHPASMPTSTNQEVVRLDIPVDIPGILHDLNALDHLDADFADGL